MKFTITVMCKQVDMVTSADNKWNFNDPDLPRHVGQINGMDKFDAQFFGVTFQLACVLEPMGRKLLEHTYGAFLDAGETNFRSPAFKKKSSRM